MNFNKMELELSSVIDMIIEIDCKIYDYNIFDQPLMIKYIEKAVDVYKLIYTKDNNISESAYICMNMFINNLIQCFEYILAKKEYDDYTFQDDKVKKIITDYVRKDRRFI